MSSVSLYSLSVSRVPHVIDIVAKPQMSVVALFGSLSRHVLQRTGSGVLSQTLIIIASPDITRNGCNKKAKVISEIVKRRCPESTIVAFVF
ncbi:hypothetical protein V6N13_147551 [Hibiscus sabdariffa]|uniref:Uncharacterized protein n=1 Tax=Hibiscus sabdariffa TaxID=183260 RepID=A0ABR2TVZ5_9ROSI